ncbi:hypothetical protein EDB81DRAFT_765586 [Dactylonectria macrodidyma]|uniref:Uncharacterized protein n=1 Tax=Dactylonectria macrodidyma TaxID=307937 RepID=A0A9P9IMR6_9HYPO|nr:hypothetical protein EDB81DRAFT_765586 [Dactylonectria macrodidyma]
MLESKSTQKAADRIGIGVWARFSALTVRSVLVASVFRLVILVRLLYAPHYRGNVDLGRDDNTWTTSVRHNKPSVNTTTKEYSGEADEIGSQKPIVEDVEMVKFKGATSCRALNLSIGDQLELPRSCCRCRKIQQRPSIAMDNVELFSNRIPVESLPERFMGRLLLRGNWGSGISGSTVFASSNMIWVTGEGKLQAEHEIAPSKVPRSGLSDVDSHCPYDGIRD